MLGSGQNFFNQNLLLLSQSSSTRMKKRPCNSGIKSLGFGHMESTEAINKT